MRDRAFRHALRDLPAAPTRRRRRLRVGAPVSAFYWGWQLHIPATVVEVRAGRDGDVVVVKYYDGDRGEVPADLGPVGAWALGRPEHYAGIGARLAVEGVTAVVVGYRTYPAAAVAGQVCARSSKDSRKRPRTP